jgi:hypothetical protein
MAPRSPPAVGVGWWHGTPRWPQGEMLRFTIDDFTAR